MTVKKITDNGDCSKGTKISTLRRAIPQFLAASAQNLILFDNGLVLSYPTVIVDALLPHNGIPSPDPLAMTKSQASWYVSISYICQPIGSILSGFFMEPLGRKRSMLLLNIPFLTAWALLYFAPSIPVLFVASAVMGLGVGCTEAPILTYMGEISEARVRGMLTSYAQLFGSLAYVALYALAWLVETWRYTAACCALIPVATALAVSLVPESPWWLVSKGRIIDAERALCWLRGWVNPESVKEELDSLISYHENDKRATASRINSASIDKLPVESTEELLRHEETLSEKLKYYTSPRMMKPFTIICLYFFFFYGSGLACIRPYLVSVFDTMEIRANRRVEPVVISIVGFIGNAVCMAAISFSGKRILSLTALLGCALSTLGLSLVTFRVLEWPPQLGLYLLYSLSFFTGLGVAPIPWMLQSELFPFKGRGIAAGCAAAVSYIIGFFATKSFFNLERAITLKGVYIIYTLISIIGAVYLYFALPETEGKTLEEIEEYFTPKHLKSDSGRSRNDTKKSKIANEKIDTPT